MDLKSLFVNLFFFNLKSIVIFYSKLDIYIIFSSEKYISFN